MVLGSQKTPPSVPTRDELYNLCYIYLALSALCLIGWGAFDIINRMFFSSSIDVESKIRPVLIIAFVFFLGMAIAFYRKARVTLFFSAPKEEELSLKPDENLNHRMIADVFIKKDENIDDGPPNKEMQ